MSSDWQQNEIVIVGAGLAGLFVALKLSPTPVTIVTSAPLGKGASSSWAQGGIAAAIEKGDTAFAHAMDTIAAGCWHRQRPYRSYFDQPGGFEGGRSTLIRHAL